METTPTAPRRDESVGPGHLALTLTFNAALGASLAAAARRRRLPARIEPGDFVLMSLAAHKLSRVVTKDKVTSAIRSPVAVRKGDGAPGEVDDAPRGSGPRKAIGELLTCPFCFDAWAAAGFVVGLVHAPRLTRAAAGVFAVMALADFLQLAYKAAQTRA
jgi:hypothetical protein